MSPSKFESNNYEEILKKIVAELDALPTSDKKQRQDLISQVVLNCPIQELHRSFLNAVLKTTLKSRTAQNDFIIAISVRKNFHYLLEEEPSLAPFKTSNFSPFNFIVCSKLIEELSVKYKDSDQAIIRKNVKELCDKWTIFYKQEKEKEDKEIDAIVLAKKAEAAQKPIGMQGNSNLFHKPALKNNLGSPINNNPSRHCTLL